MAKANKKQILLLVALIGLTLVVLLFLNKDKIKIFQSDANVVLKNDQIDQLRAEKLRIEKVLTENKKFLQSDDGFLDDLDSYINLPMTEEEYKIFIGKVHNDYPFGNPISEVK